MLASLVSVYMEKDKMAKARQATSQLPAPLTGQLAPEGIETALETCQLIQLKPLLPLPVISDTI